MAGNSYYANRLKGFKAYVLSFTKRHPSRPFWLAALLALLLAPGAAFAWHVQTAGSNVATTNAFPKQSSTSNVSNTSVTGGEPAAPPAPEDGAEAAPENFSARVTNEGGQTSVQINGQDVPVPSSGSTQTTTNGNNTTVVDVSVNSATNSSQSTFSSTFINTNTSSSTEVTTGSDIDDSEFE